MNLLRDNDPRFRALPWKLALFGLSAFISAVLIMLYLAARQGYFEAKTPLTFVSDNGNDLKLGMAVKFSGFKIGDVTDLKLDDRGRVRIAVLIENRHLKWIKSDSVGRVAKDGLIGDGYIDVGIGSLKLPPVKRDTELEFIPAKSMDDVLREVQNRAMPVIRQVESLITQFNDPQGDLRQTMANMRSFSAGLSETRSKLDAALDGVNRLASKDAPATLSTTRQLLQDADQSLKMLESRLPAMLDTADKSLGHVEAITKASQNLVEQASPDAIGLVHEGRDLARKGNETVDAVSGAWPLNKLIAPPPTQAPRSDSQGITP